MGQIDLARLWGYVADGADNDRQHLNQLDESDDGDAGDNYAANMRLVAETLDRELRGGQGDAGQALMAAAEQLRQNGRGKTAEIYASGLANAAPQLQGRSGVGLTDLMPLLQGLLQGAQGSSGALPQGQGGILDALIPGVMGYLSAKQQGMGDTDALLAAINAAQSGAGAALPGSQSVGGGMLPGTPAQGGQVQQNPGAAGVGSMLQGLLQGMMAQQGSGSQPGQRSTFEGPDTIRGTDV